MIDSNIIHTIHDVIYTPAEGQDLSEMHLKKSLINVNKSRSQEALDLFVQKTQNNQTSYNCSFHI